jgi:hypothetical protein
MSIFTKITVAGALCAGLALSHNAAAQTLDFTSRLSTGNVLSGVLDGTLLVDGNTFDVTSVASLYVNGAAVTTPTSVQSTDYVGGYSASNVAVVTLDGSYLDFYFGDGSDAFAGAVGDLTASELFGFNAIGATTGYGGDGDFDALMDGYWSASIAAVPEPAGLAVFAVGLLALGMVRARKSV